MWTYNGTARYALLGGAWYGGSDLPGGTTSSARPQLGDAYGRVRVADRQADDGTLLRSAHYLKAPIAVVQGDAGAVLWELTLAHAPSLPLVGLHCHAGRTELRQHLLAYVQQEKTCTHFGDWTETMVPAPPTAVAVQEWCGADWRVLVRDYARRLMARCPVAADRTAWRQAGLLARRYLQRAALPRPGVHAEFMRRHAPDHIGGNSLLTLTAYELERALTLAALDDAGTATRAWQAVILDETASVVLPELGNLRVWHNTFGLRDGKCYGHTEYATGLTGYPGGQANLLTAALRLWQQHCDWPGSERLRAGLAWLLHTQLPDGGWALVYPTLPAAEDAAQRQATSARSAIGATAAAARALLVAADALQDETYRRAALRALAAVNPRPPHYAFAGCGTLRDAGETEQDGVSAVELLHANLLAWQQTGEEQYCAAAAALGCLLITWQRGWGSDPQYHGCVDPMVSSFSPRLAAWDTMLWAEAYLALADATNDDFWRALGAWTAAKVLPLQDPRSGGWSESWALDAAGKAHPFYLENGITVWGVRLALALGADLSLPVRPVADGAALPGVTAAISAEQPALVPELARALLPRPVKRLLRRLHPVRRVPDESVPSLDGIPAACRPATAGWQVTTAVLETGAWQFVLQPPPAARVARVFFPVLRWAEPVSAVQVTASLGGVVTACAVVVGTQTLHLTFAFPWVDAVYVRDGALWCETTLAAHWCAGAPLQLVVSCTGQ